MGTRHGANERENDLSYFDVVDGSDGSGHGHAGASIRLNDGGSSGMKKPKGSGAKPSAENRVIHLQPRRKPKPAPRTDVVPGLFPLVWPA